MAKIDRFDGNLAAFASTATGTNRTIFGSISQSDTLDDNITANFLTGWEIIGATDAPSKQDFNGLSYTTTLLLSYLHQMGVAEWNTSQEYYIGSAAIYDGEFYISKTDANVGNQPDVSTGNWKRLVTAEEVLPAGAVQWFAQSVAPSGWLECDGTTYLMSAYPILGAALGSTYGGDGITDFAVPDLRGKFVRGYDNGAGVDTGRVFGSSQNDSIIDHQHDAGGTFNVQLGSSGRTLAGGVETTTYTNFVKAPNDGGTETRPKNVALLPCIKT